MGSESRLSEWVDYTVDVTRRTVDVFPGRSLLDRLSATFETTVGWTWFQDDGHHGNLCLHPPPGWPPPGAVDVWESSVFEHPLHRWYLRTGATLPMTIDRVPREVVDWRCVSFAREVLGSADLIQQLGIPVRMPCNSGHDFGAFVIARGDRDFTDGQVATAQRLQPLLMLMERHVSLVACADADFAAPFGLTVRESDVLHLLRQGMTMGAIGRHLYCSPRTVEKHLEHLYRKMGVRDRLAAVRLADDHIPPAGRQRTAVSPRPIEGGLAGDADDRADLVLFTGLFSASPAPDAG